MDKDALLRKQIQDEVQSQFASKLKEAKEGKLQAEEELESAAERWRSERRRLNLDVDRLESELARTKEKASKNSRTDTKAAGMDPMEVARMQTAADERMKKAAGEWEAERTRLIAQSERLERAVAETIERSNNPLRSTQPVKEQFEHQVEEITRAKQKVEDDFRRAQMEWAEEKIRMTGELIKLRRTSTQMKPAGTRGKPDNTEELQTRISTLETQLNDASKAKEQLSKELEAATKSFDSERERLTAEAQANSNAKARLTVLEAEVRQLTGDRDRLAKELTALRILFEEDRERYAAEILKAGAAEPAANALRAERASLQAQIQQLERTVSETRERVSNEIIDQLRQQYDSKIQEIVREKTQLSEQLEGASSQLEAERARFIAEIGKSHRPDTVDQASGNAAIEAELARVETLLQKIGELIDSPDTDLSTVIRKNVEKAELDAYLKGILFSAGRGKGMK